MTSSAPLRQCVILVGGAGTRLGELARDLPKPLLPVGGRPFLEWLLAKAARQGLDRVLLLAGHKAEAVHAYVQGGVGERLGLQIEVSVEQTPLGTAGALAQAAARLDDSFLMLNGDTWFDFDWSQLRANDACDAMMALRRLARAGRYETVALSEGKVTALLARDAAAGDALINGGSYILRRRIFDAMAAAPASMEQDVLPRLCARGVLGGQLFDAPFIDIGVPEDYAAAQTMIRVSLD